MKVLDFTKKKNKLVDKLVKLGFHYQSTDNEPASLGKPSRLITTWANVMNGVTLQIIDTYDERHGANDELITTPRKYVRITDDCTNISVTMSFEEFMELEQITNSKGITFPRLGNIQRNDFQIQRNDLKQELRKYVK
jgi:hypothetical protein